VSEKDRKVTEAQWLQAREQYEQRGLSMQEIADNLGVSKPRVGQVSKKEGWVKGARQLVLDTSTPIPVVKPALDTSWSSQPLKRQLLDQNEEEIIDMLSEGKDYATVSKRFGCHVATFAKWIDATEERALAVSRARQQASFLFIQQAEDALSRPNMTNTEVTQARELASHLRWKAKAFNPRIFGDKQQIEMSGSVKAELSDDDVDKRLKELSRTVDVVARVLPNGSTPGTGT